MDSHCHSCISLKILKSHSLGLLALFFFQSVSVFALTYTFKDQLSISMKQLQRFWLELPWNYRSIWGGWSSWQFGVFQSISMKCLSIYLGLLYFPQQCFVVFSVCLTLQMLSLLLTILFFWTLSWLEFFPNFLFLLFIVHMQWFLHSDFAKIINDLRSLCMDSLGFFYIQNHLICE